MILVKLAVRSLVRNKFRTVMTIVGVGVAIFTFILLRTAVVAWSTAAEYAPKDRLVTRHKSTFTMFMPVRHLATLRRIPGVRVATSTTWFAGRDPNHEKEFFPTIAAGDQYLEVWDEMQVPPDQKESWLQDTTGAVVGAQLATKMGWKLGDRVSLNSGIFPASPDHPWTFTIRALYTTSSAAAERKRFIFHWKYLNDSLPQFRRDLIGAVISRVDSPTSVGEISRTIDSSFAASDVATLTQDEKSYQADALAASAAVLGTLDIVSLTILGIMILVLGNTLAMSISDRTKEVGVMRALGFRRSDIAFLVMSEGATLAFLGGALGLGSSYLMIDRGAGPWIEANLGSLLPYFRVAPGVALAAIGAAAFLGALASAIPAYWATRIEVVTALRRVA